MNKLAHFEQFCQNLCSCFSLYVSKEKCEKVPQTVVIGLNYFGKYHRAIHEDCLVSIILCQSDSDYVFVLRLLQRSFQFEHSQQCWAVPTVVFSRQCSRWWCWLSNREMDLISFCSSSSFSLKITHKHTQTWFINVDTAYCSHILVLKWLHDSSYDFLFRSFRTDYFCSQLVNCALLMSFLLFQ